LRDPGLTMDAAERIQHAIRQRRIDRGEQPVGYKIGFTNRRIWPIYGVSSPIWGPVYASTVERLDAPRVRIEAGRHAEPRFEPEIVLGLGHTPAADDPAAVAAAIAWVAHGVEVVQSVYPGWRFTAAESMASQALHGSLHIGPGAGRPRRCPAAGASGRRSHLAIPAPWRVGSRRSPWCSSAARARTVPGSRWPKASAPTSSTGPSRRSATSCAACASGACGWRPATS